jgi:hypothetical protein
MNADFYEQASLFFMIFCLGLLAGVCLEYFSAKRQMKKARAVVHQAAVQHVVAETKREFSS